MKNIGLVVLIAERGRVRDLEFETRSFFVLDALEKVAFDAGLQFFGICALNFATAECTGYPPAVSSGVFTAVCPVIVGISRNRTVCVAVRIGRALTLPALFEFPTV